MRYSAFFISLLAIGSGLAVPRPVSAQVSASSFAKAIANGSTSPSYVLITVINDNTGTRRTICTGANFFLGALHYEHHLPYTAQGMQEGKTLALASADRAYHFSQPAALDNLRVWYTPRTLAQMRRLLKGVSTPDVVTGMAYNGRFQRAYQKYRSFSNFAAHRDALAYVLLERGLQPRQGDITGGVYLAR